LGTALAHIELGLAEILNKEDAVTVFVSVEAAHLPADIDRRSPLIAGSSQPGRPARTYAHINVTEYRNENPIDRLPDCRLAGCRKPRARNRAIASAATLTSRDRTPRRRAKNALHCRKSAKFRWLKNILRG
jgi:hypothetical protein